MKETITCSSQDSRLFSKLKLSCVSKKFNEREVTLKKAWHTKVNPNTSPNLSLCTRSLKVHARISTFFMHGIIEKSNTHSSVYLNRSLSTIESIFTKTRAEFQVQILIWKTLLNSPSGQIVKNRFQQVCDSLSNYYLSRRNYSLKLRDESYENQYFETVINSLLLVIFLPAARLVNISSSAILAD